MTVTLENITHVVVEKVRCNVQAQFEQTRVDAQWREAETRRQVEKIAEVLSTLTEQLNRFRPVSASDVKGSQHQISDAVDG